MADLTCSHCGEPIADQSTYVLIDDATLHPLCWKLREGRALRVVAAVRHALEHSRYAVNEDIVQAMREGGFWVGEQRQ